jgi:hypothetical protein
MPEEEESGIDELMRLSRQFTKQQEEHERQERQREEQGKKVRGVLEGLKDLNLSMALDQLKEVAKPDIIRQVTALKSGGGTEELRKIITNLADEMEKQLNTGAISKIQVAKLADSTRTLSILLDLYFSMQ